MAHIRVKELQEGMVLSGDVCDQNGRFLIGAGCELTQKHIRALQSWGVITVDIEGDGVSDEARLDEIPDNIRLQIETTTQEHFRHTDLDHPFMRALYDAAIQVKARDYLKEL